MRLLVLLLLATLPGHADETSAEALARYQRGSQRYQSADFQGALAEFETAYQLKADAALLFDLAQCHRQLGQKREAARRYREFLEKARDLDEARRKKIEQLIDQLDPQPIAPVPPAPAPLPALVLAPTPHAAVHKKSSRWWLWPTVAGVAVVVGVAVGVGVGVGQPRSTSQAPQTSSGTFHF